MPGTDTPERDTLPGVVLLADDDPTVRKLARTALEKDGHRVVIAENGEEACRLFDEHVPDVVLLDVVMPIVSGFDACTRLRRSAGGQRTPIVMLTASDDVEAVARSFDVGATDFQTKPVRWRVLRERVKYLLRAKRDADELTQLAQYDGLTGLFNRAAFRGHVERALRVAKDNDESLAVIFLDLDGFKEINDTFGHEFGDQILKLTAARLTHGLRSVDAPSRSGRREATSVVSRFGGDEFTVCLANIANRDTATVVAGRVRDALASPFSVDGREVFVTASTGLSVYPVDGADADTLLQHADAAMYGAKALGRNGQRAVRVRHPCQATDIQGRRRRLRQPTRPGTWHSSEESAVSRPTASGGVRDVIEPVAGCSLRLCRPHRVHAFANRSTADAQRRPRQGREPSLANRAIT